jgi:hypothetical protein
MPAIQKYALEKFQATVRHCGSYFAIYAACDGFFGAGTRILNRIHLIPHVPRDARNLRERAGQPEVPQQNFY